MTELAAPTWDLTLADVEMVTGVVVEDGDLRAAAESIEIYTNRSPAASGNMLKRDIRWIKKAICWQAAWLMEQPDYHARTNFDRVNQDGQTVDMSPASSPYGREYSVTLAPMAARALKNLSWKASRSLRTPRDESTNNSLGVSGFLWSDNPWDSWDRLS